MKEEDAASGEGAAVVETDGPAVQAKAMGEHAMLLKVGHMSAIH